VTYSAPARTAARRTRPLAISSSPAAPDHHGALAEGNATVPKTGITAYGCEHDEAVLFREMAPGLGIVPTVTDATVSEANIELTFGNRCVSVGHKTHIATSTLFALRQAGVMYISTRSVGCNHIDVQCAQSLGITVETVAYSPDSVADYTLMLMLMAVRNAKSTLSRAEAQDYRLNHVRGRELRDMTIGVIGTGRIGAAVIDRLWGFGSRVLAYDRNPKTSARYVPLDELLQHSDVVTLHTPLNADTHHLLNRQCIEQMRPGAFIVNTGRGPLLDTEALILGLESGRLGGAALDVLEAEEGVFYSDHRQRPIENQLLLRLQQLPNVLITPHTAYYTDHALSDTIGNTLINCLRFEGRAAWTG
jgi:D-specific alpha-keto acid dehydrogenase